MVKRRLCKGENAKMKVEYTKDLPVPDYLFDRGTDRLMEDLNDNEPFGYKEHLKRERNERMFKFEIREQTTEECSCEECSHEEVQNIEVWLQPDESSDDPEECGVDLMVQGESGQQFFLLNISQKGEFYAYMGVGVKGLDLDVRDGNRIRLRRSHK